MKNKFKFTIAIISIAMMSCDVQVNENKDEDVTQQAEDVEVLTDEVLEVLEEEMPEVTPDEHMQSFFDDQIGDIQVLIQGTVIKNLPDDNEGSRHQKFIVELASEQTILISHNIDLANRIDDLQEGDELLIYGEYEWNDRGGVIHWTHHDPMGEHVGGWIDHNGTRYE